MAKIIVTLNTLKAANKFSLNEGTRYYLKGVFFDAINGVLAATDGHKLIVVKPEETELKGFDSFILPAHIIKALKGGTKQRNASVLIETDKKEIGVYDTRTTPSLEDFDVAFGAIENIMRYVPIDGTFPDYARVIPDANNYPAKGNENVSTFNPAILGTLAGDVNGLTIFQNESNKSPMAFCCDKPGHFEAFGLIMPMRCESTAGKPFPAWLKFKDAKNSKKNSA